MGEVTDKIEQGYLSAYFELAAALPDDPVVVEIGCAHGAGLALFRSMWPSGTLIGVDHLRPPELVRTIWEIGAKLVMSDQADPALPAKILARCAASPSLVVDDASHDGPKTLGTWALLWPIVAPGGFYVVEDWFVGFDTHPDYDGSMLDFARQLLMTLDGQSLIGVESVTYRYGMIVIKKRDE
jgi:cephalosporin hydroxylase